MRKFVLLVSVIVLAALLIGTGSSHQNHRIQKHVVAALLLRVPLRPLDLSPETPNILHRHFPSLRETLKEAHKVIDRAEKIIRKPLPPIPPPHHGGINWQGVHMCESGDWYYNGPSGFDGGLQFLPSTWTTVMRHLHYTRYAWQATPSQQIAAAEYLIGPLHANPWTQWPVCWKYA